MCAYLPRHVRSLADALGGRGGHHLLVSSISVYDAPIPAGSDEDAPLLAPAGEDVEEVTGETYGALKVACEQVAHDRSPRLTISRPSYIVGPLDPTGRFSWWVDRIARGGDVLVPGPWTPRCSSSTPATWRPSTCTCSSRARSAPSTWPTRSRPAPWARPSRPSCRSSHPPARG